ncbi:MAG: hypothetical protein ACRQFF_02855 [Sphaerochaeta sp.]
MDNINNVLWYSLGAFDYFLDKEDKNKSAVFDNCDIETIENQIAQFHYTEEECESKRKEIKKNIQNRQVFDEKQLFNKKQVEYIFNLYDRDGLKSLNSFIKETTSEIKSGDLNDDEDILNDRLFKIESFIYLKNVTDLDTFDLFAYYSKVIVLLNLTIDSYSDSDRDFFYRCDDIKQKLYQLIRDAIFDIYCEGKNKKDLIFCLKTFEILDLFTIFNASIQVFPTSMVDYLLHELYVDNEKDVWPINRYHCFKMFLLEMKDPLDDEYLELYDEYFPIENDNAYLMMALKAHYNGDESSTKEYLNLINSDNLNTNYESYYYDLLNLPDGDNSKNYKDTDAILDLIESKDRENLNEYLTSFNTNSLSGYALLECVKAMLDASRYNSIEAETILYCSPISLKNYLSRDSSLIQDDDIAELYIFSTILLNLNLVEESCILLSALRSRVSQANEIVLNTIAVQLEMSRKLLGYKNK